MKRQLIRLILIVAGVVLLVMGGVVSAHEQRTVGNWQIAFGWRNEPTYVGEFTGPEVFIAPANATPEAGEDEVHASEADMANVEVNLQAEVTFGDQSTKVTFYPADDPGHYIADLIPTLPGDYTFHLTGKIGDTQVDETFTSANGQFSTVDPSSDIEFPSAQSLEARVTTLEQEVQQLQDAVKQLQNK
ncbi:MAG TPA: hypothetical protein VHD90_12990 [Phototrophicaceae bacterium]|nr:hypothetical protein [Phototrophicaceae bacterium]